MIYAGTMPELDDLGNPVNGVNVGNTPRGTVFRNHTRKGKSSGMLRKPAMAMLWCGRYWTDSMPAPDKTWWADRAAADSSRSRADVDAIRSGYSLFLQANIAAICLGQAPVKVPFVGSVNFTHEIALDSIDSSTNFLKLYAVQKEASGTPYFLEWFLSAIRPGNRNDSDPMRSTILFARVLANSTLASPQPPVPAQYFSLPFKVDPGDKINIHIQYRSGYKSGGQPWQSEAWTTQLRELTAT